CALWCVPRGCGRGTAAGAGALPGKAQPVQRPTDALARGLDAEGFLQVAHKQGSGPDRAAVAVVARVEVDDSVDQRVDDPQGSRRPTAAGGVAQAGQRVQVGALLEGVHPVVDGAWLHMKQFRDAGDRLPLMEPHQSLSTAKLLGVMGMAQQVEQLATFPPTELESRHASPPSSEGGAKPVPVMKELSSSY